MVRKSLTTLLSFMVDSLEIRYFKSGTTNQTTIYVRVREQFFSVGRLAATTSILFVC